MAARGSINELVSALLIDLFRQVLKEISPVNKHNIFGLLVAGTKGGEASLWRGNNADSVPYLTALKSDNVCQPRCSWMVDFLCFLIPRQSEGWSNLLTLSKVLLLGQTRGAQISFPVPHFRSVLTLPRPAQLPN